MQNLTAITRSISLFVLAGACGLLAFLTQQFVHPSTQFGQHFR